MEYRAQKAVSITACAPLHQSTVDNEESNHYQDPAKAQEHFLHRPMVICDEIIQV